MSQCIPGIYKHSSFIDFDDEIAKTVDAVKSAFTQDFQKRDADEFEVE